MYKVLSIVIIIVFLLPAIVTLTSSFMSDSELSAVYDSSGTLRLIPNRVTGENYFNILFANESFLSMFWNSLFIASSITILQLCTSIIMAYVFTKVKFRGRGMILFLYTVIMLMPYQVTLLPNYLMSKQIGIYNTWAALILPAAFSPLGAMILYLFMLRLPNDILEAALLETNSQWTVMTRIALPNIRHGLVVVAALAFIDGWNMVEQPLILLKDEWLYPLSLALNDVRGTSPGTAFGGATLYAMPIVLIYMLCKDTLFDTLVNRVKLNEK